MTEKWGQIQHVQGKWKSVRVSGVVRVIRVRVIGVLLYIEKTNHIFFNFRLRKIFPFASHFLRELLCAIFLVCFCCAIFLLLLSTSFSVIFLATSCTGFLSDFKQL